MKNKILGSVTFFSVVCLTPLRAQNESDLSAFMTAEKNDASKLVGAYISPLIKGFSYGMTGGWYHTGKTHNKLGVDLGVSVSTVMLPSSEETFNPTKIGLSGTITPNQTVSPTIIGSDNVSPNSYNVNYTQGPITVSQSFTGPQGLNFKKNIGGNWVPVPMIQLGIGLIKSTDLKIRYLPEQKYGDNSRVKMLGFGLMHDIKQHIPGIKMLPFDLSVLVAYNSVDGTSSLVNTNTGNDGKPYSTDGKLSYTLNSWVAQAIVSKKVAVLTFYLGVGYGAVSTKAKITGRYVLDPYNATTIANPLIDPFATNYSNNSAKLTTGIRLKLGPIYFNGDYTVQKFSALTIGFGASIR